MLVVVIVDDKQPLLGGNQLMHSCIIQQATNADTLNQQLPSKLYWLRRSAWSHVNQCKNASVGDYLLTLALNAVRQLAIPGQAFGLVASSTTGSVSEIACEVIASCSVNMGS